MYVTRRVKANTGTPQKSSPKTAHSNIEAPEASIMTAEVMQSLKSIQDSMKNMNASLVSLTGEVAQIRVELDSVKDLQHSLEHTQADLADTKKDIETLQCEFKTQALQNGDILKQLNASRAENTELKEKLLHLDTYIRRENLKFIGIAEGNGESVRDCHRKIREMFVNNLEIANIDDIEFQRCHRLGKKSNTGSYEREIIVRFLRYEDREMVWNRKTKLKNSGIVIKEDFPAEIESRRARLYPILKAARGRNQQASLIGDTLYIDGRPYTVSTMNNLPQDLQLRNLSTRTLDDAVLFYGRYSIFSNFHQRRFVLDGQEYSSVEQYFQCQKAIRLEDHDTAASIMATNDPVLQLRLGRKPRMDKNKWNNTIAKQVMETAVKTKFEQNEDLKNQLLATGNRNIVECNKYDKLWGNGLSLYDANAAVKAQWKGENALGTILVMTREALK